MNGGQKQNGTKSCLHAYAVAVGTVSLWVIEAFQVSWNASIANSLYCTQQPSMKPLLSCVALGWVWIWEQYTNDRFL